jgi:DNA-binding NarL/FixJ family response regulator
MVRIVVADDHTIVREGLKQILAGQPDFQVVAEASDGHEALKRVRELEFDVLLLDMSMPGKSGVELIKQVKAEKPKLRILVLTMHEEHQYAVRAIRAGASGYLTKEGASSQLVTALRHARRFRSVARASVGPRVPGLPHDRRGQVGLRNRRAPQSLGEDREHAQGEPAPEDEHDHPGRADPLRPRAQPGREVLI